MSRRKMAYAAEFKAGRVSVYSPSRLRVVDNDAGKRVLTAA
jgi:hypothetical protein